MDITDILKTDILNEVISILMNCEEIQDSNESAYTKEQAKITAYNEILEALTSYERLVKVRQGLVND